MLTLTRSSFEVSFVFPKWLLYKTIEAWYIFCAEKLEKYSHQISARLLPCFRSFYEQCLATISTQTQWFGNDCIYWHMFQSSKTQRDNGWARKIGVSFDLLCWINGLKSHQNLLVWEPWSMTQNSRFKFFRCWLFIYGMPIVISMGVWHFHPWAIWEIEDGRQYGCQHLSL